MAFKLFDRYGGEVNPGDHVVLYMPEVINHPWGVTAIEAALDPGAPAQSIRVTISAKMDIGISSGMNPAVIRCRTKDELELIQAERGRPKVLV